MKSPLPKVLHEVDGIPMLQRVINESKKLGVKNTIVIVGYKKELIKETINDDTILYVTQPER